MTDQEWIAERRRRMADIIAELETEQSDEPAADEVAPTDGIRAGRRRDRWYTSLLALLVLLFASWLLISCAFTLGRFTGNSLSDARQRGTATVEQCLRRGPVTLWHGFGFYRECTVTVTWADGSRNDLTISKPGFFTKDKPGDTFEIGQNTGSRGRVGYSRAELPERTWVAVVAGVLDVVGALLLLAILISLWRDTKNRLRRR